MKFAIMIVTTLSLAACSWGIKLDSGGRDVRVAWQDDVSQCRLVGAITVSVLGKVGPVDRNALKVSDELEVMARNQAASMQADTVKPIDKPRNGEQNWNAYTCGASASRAPVPSPGSRNSDAVETYPIKDH
ncbi:MAG TPA: DUF4156 domain-containing protein [Dokdonella sp.]|uniref:DUF4156 domain-containing protein n=1 Tax=Dokdonella sp. TaxID=2291710 RepID=UPI002D80AB86|nr:DUF4156 domain-containing protein [Dokdonella sp.]HET9033238.1 DUF4156 domain-containing protein [Dokdonella sp.]